MVVEVSEIKSYKLSDDGNMVTIMMKDGTVHNNLIFLDEGLADIFNSLEFKIMEQTQLSFFLFLSFLTLLLLLTHMCLYRLRRI